MKDNFPIRLREQNALLPEQDTVLARFKQLILGGGDVSPQSVEVAEDPPEAIDEPIPEEAHADEDASAAIEDEVANPENSPYESSESDGEDDVVAEETGISDDDTVLFEGETIVDNDDASWFEPYDEVDTE